MRLTANEREQRDDAAYQDQVQAELDAYTAGRDAGRAGAAAGCCPDYPSRGECDAWMDGWRAATLASMARAA